MSGRALASTLRVGNRMSRSVPVSGRSPPSGPEELARALVATELVAPYRLNDEVSIARLLRENGCHLRKIVPYAALRLVERLATSGRVEVRSLAAESLRPFIDLYPERVEALLLRLCADSSRRVRAACREPLAALLLSSRERRRLVERFDKRSKETKEVLAEARRAIPPPPPPPSDLS
jgi:hypothetical protein